MKSAPALKNHSSTKLYNKYNNKRWINQLEPMRLPYEWIQVHSPPLWRPCAARSTRAWKIPSQLGPLRRDELLRHGQCVLDALQKMSLTSWSHFGTKALLLQARLLPLTALPAMAPERVSFRQQTSRAFEEGWKFIVQLPTRPSTITRPEWWPSPDI